MIRHCVGLSLMLVACAGPPGPREGDAGEVVVLPVVSAPSSAVSVSRATADPATKLVSNVALRQRFDDAAIHCYCAAVFATDDLASQRLEWKGGAPPLPVGTILFVADLARMQCAIPMGVGVPSFEQASRNGADVEVDLRWRFDREPVQSAAFIPAPAPGGRVMVRLHGSWMGGGDTANLARKGESSNKVEMCEASR